MASTKQLAALFRAIAAENVGGATEIAALICNQEEKKGHDTAARMLRGALNASRNEGTDAEEVSPCWARQRGDHPVDGVDPSPDGFRVLRGDSHERGALRA